MLRLKLNHVSKRGPRWPPQNIHICWRTNHGIKTRLKSKAQFMDKQQTPATLEDKLGNLAQFSWQLLLIMRQVPWIDPSHRCGHPQAACREPAGSYDKTTRVALCFEHKTQYLLIRAPYTCIVVFWHISNIPPMISQSQISCNTTTFCIAAIQPAVGCYNSWANLRCSGYLPLGGKLLWNRSIAMSTHSPMNLLTNSHT